MVVIGVLASITVVTYTGIAKKAVLASVQFETATAKQQLKVFQAAHPDNSFPLTIDCELPNSDTNLCIRSNENSELIYTPNNASNPKSFTLVVENEDIAYRVTNLTNPVVNLLDCPSGFITVPGSATYGTNDFCVMKYEAKADENGDGIGDTHRNTGYNTWPANSYPISSSRKLVSSAVGYPVVNISQNTAISNAQAANYVYDCPSGCHVITEAEWMTIAQNVLSVPSNWSGGAVGSGYIFSGHNDGSPANALPADLIDTNGYSGTGDSSGDAGITNDMVGNSQRRTLTLTNGEVIWDFAGNIYEWTAGKTNGSSAQQPGVAGNNYNSFIEWPAVSVAGSLSVNPNSNTTGLAGVGTWNSTNGIGKLLSSTTDTTLVGHLRGGDWNHRTSAGVLMLGLGASPIITNYFIGFRVAK